MTESQAARGKPLDWSTANKTVSVLFGPLAMARDLLDLPTRSSTSQDLDDGQRRTLEAMQGGYSVMSNMCMAVINRDWAASPIGKLCEKDPLQERHAMDLQEVPSATSLTLPKFQQLASRRCTDAADRTAEVAKGSNEQARVPLVADARVGYETACVMTSLFGAVVDALDTEFEKFKHHSAAPKISWFEVLEKAEGTLSQSAISHDLAQARKAFDTLHESMKDLRDRLDEFERRLRDAESIPERWSAEDLIDDFRALPTILIEAGVGDTMFSLKRTVADPYHAALLNQSPDEGEGVQVLGFASVTKAPSEEEW